MSLQVKLRQGILLCLLLPVTIIFIGINVAVYYHFARVHAEKAEILNDEAVHALERVVTTEVLRLNSLTILPNVNQLLTVAERANKSLSITGRRERMAEVETQWTSLGREEVMVRNVLNNSVGEMFQHLVQYETALKRLWLTDAAGAVLGASDKTDRFDYSEAAWWNQARAQGKNGQVISEGVNSEGLLGLALSIWEDGNTPVFRGVLRAEVQLPQLALDTSERTDFPSILLADQPWSLTTSSVLTDEMKEESFWADFNARDGRTHGFHYSAKSFMPDVAWAKPAQVITFHPEGAFPLVVYGPLLISILLSLVALFALVYIAFMAGRNIFFRPYNELIEAGQWVLQAALKQNQGAAVSKDARFPITTTPHPVTKELDEWLAQRQAEAKEAGTAISHEMQADLELAKDFQLSYLNRPYPKIPEVHYEGRLRLEFSHRYMPALALGGDFFDLIPLATDTVGVLVADVMGHGARSALITAILRTLLRDLSPQGRNARHFISEVNKQFCDVLKSFPQPIFASAFYFVPDTTSRVATFSTAGHPAPFHIRRSVGRITRLDVPSPHGAALGIIPGEQYTGGHVRLLAGDVYLFFTDGVYETSNPEGQEFGLARIEKVLRQYMYKSVQTIIDELIGAMETFARGEPIQDDICIVAVEVTTTPEPPPTE